MIKQIQKLKCAIVRIFEEELIAVLALLMVVAVFGLSTHAQTSDQTDLHFVICPVGGSLTVTRANGGERWRVNDTENITWLTCDADGSIANVKIELQRDTGGTWETLVGSTPNNGTYAWPVTEPTTFTALLRVSNASDPTVNDTSDSVFEIYKSGGGPHPCANVVIDKVVPWTFVNTEDVTLIITGYFAYGDEQVYLDEELLDSTYISQERIDAIVPAGFPPGSYVLKVTNYCGNYAEYAIKIVVYKGKCHNPVIDEVTPTTFSNSADVTLVVKGHFEYGNEKVYLDDALLKSTYISNTKIEALVPAGFTPGSYTLSVVNGCGGRAEYGTKIIIYKEEEKPEEPKTIIEIIIPPILSLIKPFIRPPSTGGVKPITPFSPESKFFTDAFELHWICYLIWLIILLLFALILKEYFSEDDPKKKKREK